MYKNYNMFQLTLPIETEMSFPENDVVFIINKLVESIPKKLLIHIIVKEVLHHTTQK